MGPELDGKLGSYSEICIMGDQRNQRVLALTVLGMSSGSYITVEINIRFRFGET